ncbi:hypothetical protein [Actinacidiphila guanduensis]|uniref:hypothetical protein n=1 Tax=Actinacidiphila guanduensis TaxID=310781 RepID=UPI0015A1766B|nr:hypothetical protein [Actinacidiphila guanduensis]
MRAVKSSWDGGSWVGGGDVRGEQHHSARDVADGCRVGPLAEVDQLSCDVALEAAG